MSRYSFPLLGRNSNSTSYLMCNQVWNGSLVPRIAVFSAVVNMAVVAYRARSHPIVLAIPDPLYLYLTARRLLLYTIILMLLNEQ